MKNPAKFLKIKLAGLYDRIRMYQYTRELVDRVQPDTSRRPVIVFNASTRLYGLSLNAGFSLLTSWSLRQTGVPVVHFACRAGMQQCTLGLQWQEPDKKLPCEACMAQSERLYKGADVRWFDWREEEELTKALAGLSVPQLKAFEFQQMPYGRLVLPSLRWALRLHNLPDDQTTRVLLRQFIQSAHSVRLQFETLLEETRPAAILLFNGLTFPEATAKFLAEQRNIRVITHEVSFQPFSSFFSAGHATAYPIRIPEDFELNDRQNAQLDEYLSKRFQGQFTMAGIKFWPEFQRLDEDFLDFACKFDQIVTVFTNVIFDTSQVHANTVFSDMFAWLNDLLEIIRSNPNTLFVIRAHPDEKRPGKASRESVSEWISQQKVEELPNVVFYDSMDFVSSYDLIQRSKFVMVYNSSIGLEAVLMGKAVLCAGKARYTQYPIVTLPESREKFRETFMEFLAADEVLLPVGIPEQCPQIHLLSALPGISVL